MARRELRGEGTARGAALGTARIRYPLDFSVDFAPIARHDVPAELARIEDAIGRARAELDAVRRRLRGPLKREIGEFVDAHALILDDPEFADGIRAGIVEQRLNAEAALKAHRDQLLAAFEAIDDPYLRSRGEDVEQVVGRVFAALKRGRTGSRRARAASGGVVLVAESIAPDEIEAWQQEGLVALVVTRASVWSHATILARALRVPMVVAGPGIFDEVRDGDPVLVDADAGLVIAGPDTLDLSRLRERQRASERSARARARLRTAETRTRDGLAIRLWANAEHAEDIALARRLGAAGIGLYRTEFLHAGHGADAGEDTQYRAYREAVLAMGGRPVTLRTLDIGGDKGTVHAGGGNPALGLRGLRLSLAQPAGFAAQLRAMLRASAHGPVRILFPMVSSLDEARRALATVEACRAELRLARAAFDEDTPIGAMVEVPAAALIADRLARTFDFLALGSNDLVQYTLAADRNDAAVASNYDPLHPAVLALLTMTLDHARRSRRPLTLCGELAADPRATALLVGLGFTDLSMHPNAMLEVRERVLGLHASALRKRVRRVVAAGEARSLVEEAGD
jgi:phosphotransferase system enzyme I (PtsI)